MGRVSRPDTEIEAKEAEITVRVCNHFGRPVSIMVYVCSDEEFIQTDDFSENTVEADGFLIVE